MSYNVAQTLRLLLGCGQMKLQRLLQEFPLAREPTASAEVLLELLTTLALRRRCKNLNKRDVRPCRRRGKKIVLVDAVARFHRCSTSKAKQLLAALPDSANLERARGLAVCSLPTLRDILPRLPVPCASSQNDLAKQVEILRLNQKRQQEQIQTLLHTDGNTLSKQTMRDLWDHKFQRRWRAKCEICRLPVLTPINAQVVVRELFAEYQRLYDPQNARLCCAGCAKQNKTQARSLRWDNRRALVWLLSFEQQYEAPCFCCQRTLLTYFAAWHMGHLLAAAQGGVSEPHNLRAICAECNATMRTQCMQDFMRARGLRTPTNRPSLATADRMLKTLRV